MTPMFPRPDTVTTAPAQETSSLPENWWHWLEGFLERMFILFCLYVLSIGPLYWSWVDAKYAQGSVWLAAFYEPLRILGELVPLFGKCLNWYVSLWVG